MKKSTLIIWHIIYAIFTLVIFPFIFWGETQKALPILMTGFGAFILGLMYWLLGANGTFWHLVKFNNLRKFDSIAGPILVSLGLIFIIGTLTKVSETEIRRYNDGFTLTRIDKDFMLIVPADSEIIENIFPYDSSSVIFGLTSDNFLLDDSTKINIVKYENTYLLSFLGIRKSYYIGAYYDTKKIRMAKIDF